MFDLRTLESDAPDTGVRLFQHRLWRACVHLTVAFGTAAAFGSVAAPAPRRPQRRESIQVYGKDLELHIWCDHVSGQCGVHDRNHQPVSPTDPRRRGLRTPA